ncbi:uncharacterized protein LOC143080192 [Mytilus galloprovincialis]|uniref:uncharacterized protein LOC143080192 n=1 Tax=Mytilus galloprovincialis TaxID=29158 RepID=UPI003F7BD4CB
MEHMILIFLVFVAMATASGHFKYYKMEKTEKVEVREFEMDSNPFSLLGKRKSLQQRGNLTNCGDKKNKFSIQWEPKILNTQGVATVYWDLVAPCDMDSGNAHIDVYLPEIPDSPIFSLDQKGTCGDIKKTVPNLTCPIKKDAEIKGQLTASDLTRLPTGNYTIEVKITNDKNELFACGRASVELTP